MANFINKILISSIILLTTHLSATAAPLTYHTDFTLSGGSSALNGATLSFDFVFADLSTYGPAGAGIIGAIGSNKLTISGAGGALNGMYEDTGAGFDIGVTSGLGVAFERFGESELVYSVGGIDLEVSLILNDGSVIPSNGDSLQTEHFDGSPDDFFIQYNGDSFDLAGGVNSISSTSSGGPTDGSGNPPPPNPVPAPGSLGLLALGLTGMIFLRRTRSKFNS